MGEEVKSIPDVMAYS